MHQLTYISSATANVTSHNVDDILAVSRRNNASNDITGLLIYDGRRFLQALEGPHEAVEAAYGRIKLDPRHRASVKLSSREIASRQFGSWEMGVQKVGVVNREGTLEETVNALVQQVADPNMKSLFREFAKIKRIDM